MRKSGNLKGGLQTMKATFPRVCAGCGYTIEQPATHCPKCGQKAILVGHGHGIHAAHRDSGKEHFVTYVELLDVSLSSHDPEHPVRAAVRLARRRGAWDWAQRIVMLAWDLATAPADSDRHKDRPAGLAELLEGVRAVLGEECSEFEPLLSSTDIFERELLMPAGSDIPEPDAWLSRLCPRCDGFFSGSRLECPNCGPTYGDGGLWRTPHGVIFRIGGDYVFREHDDVLDDYLGPETTVRAIHPWRRALHSALRRDDYTTAYDLSLYVGSIGRGLGDPQENLQRVNAITRTELAREGEPLPGDLPGEGETVVFITAPSGKS